MNFDGANFLQVAKFCCCTVFCCFWYGVGSSFQNMYVEWLILLLLLVLVRCLWCCSWPMCHGASVLMLYGRIYVIYIVSAVENYICIMTGKLCITGLNLLNLCISWDWVCWILCIITLWALTRYYDKWAVKGPNFDGLEFELIWLILIVGWKKLHQLMGLFHK